MACSCQCVAGDEIEVLTLDAAGTTTRSERFSAPYCPRVCRQERVQRGKPCWHRHSTRQTRVAVIPRAQGMQGLRRFTCLEIAMQTHTVNAWDEERAGERWSLERPDAKCEIGIRRLVPHIGEMPAIDPRFT